MSTPLIVPEIDPVLVSLGPLAIRWYALAYITGIIAGWLYIGRLIRKPSLWSSSGAPIQNEHLDDLILWMTLGIVLGGRTAYVLFYNTSMIWERPLDMIKIWEGGMSFHGGFLGVVAAAIIYCRRKAFDWTRILSVGDLLACAAPIGLFFGRIANFINGELWGRPTDLPWGMVFCNTYTTDVYGNCAAGYVPRHPSQLYEAALEGLLLFGALWYVSHKLDGFKRPGLLMGTFIAGYGVIRILMETVRNPDEQIIEALKGMITMGMLLSVPMVLAGAWLIRRALKAPAQA